MKPISVEAQKLLIRIAEAVVSAIRQAGPAGAPAGLLYAPMSAQGCTLQAFEQIMQGLVQAGAVARTSDGRYVAAQPGKPQGPAPGHVGMLVSTKAAATDPGSSEKVFIPSRGRGEESRDGSAPLRCVQCGDTSATDPGVCTKCGAWGVLPDLRQPVAAPPLETATMLPADRPGQQGLAQIVRAIKRQDVAGLRAIARELGVESFWLTSGTGTGEPDGHSLRLMLLAQAEREADERGFKRSSVGLLPAALADVQKLVRAVKAATSIGQVQAALDDCEVGMASLDNASDPDDLTSVRAEVFEAVAFWCTEAEGIPVEFVGLVSAGTASGAADAPRLRCVCCGHTGHAMAGLCEQCGNWAVHGDDVDQAVERLTRFASEARERLERYREACVHSVAMAARITTSAAGLLLQGSTAAAAIERSFLAQDDVPAAVRRALQAIVARVGQ